MRQSQHILVAFPVKWDDRPAGHGPEIEVRKETRFLASQGHPIVWQPATVNWPGCGSKNAKNADKFLSAMILAVAKANELDEQYPSGTELV